MAALYGGLAGRKQVLLTQNSVAACSWLPIWLSLLFEVSGK